MAMQRQNVIRAFLFVVFFSVGAAALGGSILCEDLARHYRNKHFLKEAKELSERLDSLNADYDALLRRLEEDPNLIKRIAPVTLGAEHEDVQTAYPKATDEQLAVSRKALEKEVERDLNEPVIPKWLVRCSEPRRRIMLFVCGAALILISFVCFGPAKGTYEEEE